jgi:hypothetical protein
MFEKVVLFCWIAKGIQIVDNFRKGVFYFGQILADSARTASENSNPRKRNSTLI